MDWQYIAGFFDGEGGVTWNKNQTGRYYPYLTISNTNRNVLDGINKFLVTHGIRSKVNLWEEDTRLAKGWKRHYWLTVYDKVSVEDCIYGMIPYMIVKVPEVERALEILEGINARSSIREGKLTKTEYQKKVREHKNWVYDYKGDLVIKYK